MTPLVHFVAENKATMNISIAEGLGGVHLIQPFEGIWSAAGLRELAAMLTGVAAMLEVRQSS